MYVTLPVADQLEIVDALYRFGLGQDLHDRELFGSSFTADAELDFRRAAARWGWGAAADGRP